MEKEFEGEWRRLEEEAVAVLNRFPERDGSLAECHGIMLPSFEDCRSYTILRPPRTRGPTLGVRRVWHRLDDLARFESPIIRLRYGPKLHPTIEEHDVTLPPEVVDDILRRAATARVPPHIPERSGGADGESYILSFGDVFVGARFEWWSEPPDGWQTLETLLRDLANAVESGLTRR